MSQNAGNIWHTFREHKRKAGVQKRNKTGGGSGFRKGFAEKVTLKMLFGGWREFPQMERERVRRALLTEGLARTRQNRIIAGECRISRVSV